MSAMVCANCGRVGIQWHNICGISPYTECPHCGGTNCERQDEPEEEEEVEDE